MIRGIVLAAGKGTRMKSARPKVLHDLCGRPMLWYVVRALRDAGVDEVTVVASRELEPELAGLAVRSVVQAEQLGTGHAVRIALEQMDVCAGGRLLVACGDMPLVDAAVFRGVLDALGRDGAPMALVTAHMSAESNFGRIVREAGRVRRIVEVRDASADELAIGEMNAGIYAFDEASLRDAVPDLRADNAQREYYLTDTVARFSDRGNDVNAVVCPDPTQVLGINDRIELARARAEMNARLCAEHMRAGVTIVDPRTTYLEPELRIGADTVIYPNTSIGRLSEIGSGCTVGPNARLSNAKIGDRVEVRESVVTDATIGDGTTVGPYAHLRGDSELGTRVRVGNFVEVKNSRLADRAKAAHLAYLGDASVGEDSNIGAGTITANYDGKTKHRTRIGKNVRIGSNSSLIAPVEIGDDALTGAGAVVTKDVAAGSRVVGNPARPLP